MHSIVRKSGLVAAAVATLSLTACYEQPRRVYREDRVVYSGAPRGCEQCGVVDDVEQIYTERDSSPLGAVIGAVAYLLVSRSRRDKALADSRDRALGGTPGADSEPPAER